MRPERPSADTSTLPINSGATVRGSRRKNERGTARRFRAIGTVTSGQSCRWAAGGRRAGMGRILRRGMETAEALKPLWRPRVDLRRCRVFPLLPATSTKAPIAAFLYTFTELHAGGREPRRRGHALERANPAN